MALDCDSLFDHFERTDGATAEYSVPEFTFLNRSSWQSVARIRGESEGWYARYPAAATDRDRERRDLRGRFRSPRDRDHASAFFELFLHELLSCLGCELLVHPSVRGTRKSPDFRVVPPHGDAFYLEATIVTGKSEDAAAAQARKAIVLDAINRLDSPNFYIEVFDEGVPRTPPSGADIRRFLQKHLSQLNPDDVTKTWEESDGEDVPQWCYSHDGWDLTFKPIPKKAEARNRPSGRPIGVQMGETQWIDSRTPMRDAILAKGHHFPILDHPLVVAVNALDEHVDFSDIMDALFGKEGVRITHTQLGEIVGEPEPFRELDGVWTSRSGPRYTRIVAVLVAVQLLPWTICKESELRLFHNPYLTDAPDLRLLRLPQAVPRDGTMELVDGEPTASILGLPEDWPVMGQKK